MDPTTFRLMMASAKAAAPLPPISLPIIVGTITIYGSTNGVPTAVSPVVTVPSTSISGDYHFVTIASSGARTCTTPAGWTLLCDVQESTTSSRLYVFYRSGLVGSSTVTFTMSGAGDFPFNITSVRGMTAAPSQRNKVSGQAVSTVASPAALAGTASTNVVAPGQPAAVTGNAQLLVFYQDDIANNTYTLPATATNIAYTVSVNNRSVRVSISGPETTDQTATTPQSEASIGVSVLLK